MSSQVNDEKLTRDDMLYLKVAIILAQNSVDMNDMFKTKTAMEERYNRIDRMYHHEMEKKRE